MRNLAFIALATFFSFNVFAGVDCIDGNYRANDRDNLRKIIAQANKAGSYTQKNIFGKNEEFKKGQAFKVAGSKKDCRRANCKIGGFCETAVYGRTTSSIGLVPGTGGYRQNIAKYCVGIELPDHTDPMTGKIRFGCYHIDKLERVK